ncbi:MAG: TolC family protein [Candidatus Omnitrophica bacterium]|nr:TolC family protein [Candidatus Omnitrophota bacterium]
MRNKTAVFIISLYASTTLIPVASAEQAMAWRECVAEAAKNNPQLIAAVEVVKGQQAAKTVVTSGLLPQFDGTFGASRAQSASNDNTSGIRESITNSYSYGVNGSQLIFDGFTTYNKVRAAAENVAAARYAYRFTSSTVRLDLRAAFINLLKAQELIRVAEEIFKIRKDDLNRVTLRYQSGLEHKGALMTAQANLADAELGLAQARRDVVLSQRQMTKEMGRRKFEPMSVEGTFEVKDSAREQPDLERLADATPSVMQAASQTRAAAATVDAALGTFAPQVSGTMGANKANTNSQWPPRGNEWDMGISVSMPLFDGAQRLGQLAQDRAAYKQAQESQRNTRDAAIVNLEDAWVALQNAMDLVRVQRMTLDATQERSRIAESQYSAGFMTFDNWIIIEDDLVRSKRAYLDAEAAALVAEAKWIQAKGETLEYE